MAMAATARDQGRRCSGARGRRGRGPEGPGAHPEVAGSVSSGGGRPVAANFAVAARRSCGETATIGGDSARLGAIPRVRRTREARRCWVLSRRRPGRLLAAARDGGHGAELGYCKQFTGGRAGREGEEEGKMRRGVVVLERDSRTSPRPSAASRRWHTGSHA
jgi:hypothetical protein